MILDPKLAVITGASRRVGKAIAIGLAVRGWKVIIHFHASTAAAHETVREIRDAGGSAEMIHADLTDPTQIDDLFEQVSQHGRLRLLINSAAVMLKTSLRNVTADEWDAIMNLNLRAPLLSSQKAYSLMDEGGLIVNISDAFARQIWRDHAVYGLSKSALEHLTLMLAESFKPRVRVNAISPGLLMRPDDITEEQWAKLTGKLGKSTTTLTDLMKAVDHLIQHPEVTGEVIQIHH